MMDDGVKTTSFPSSIVYRPSSISWNLNAVLFVIIHRVEKKRVAGWLLNIDRLNGAPLKCSLV
jgi:hypothetical protein